MTLTVFIKEKLFQPSLDYNAYLTCHLIKIWPIWWLL